MVNSSRQPTLLVFPGVFVVAGGGAGGEGEDAVVLAVARRVCVLLGVWLPRYKPEWPCVYLYVAVGNEDVNGALEVVAAVWLSSRLRHDARRAKE